MGRLINQLRATARVTHLAKTNTMTKPVLESIQNCTQSGVQHIKPLYLTLSDCIKYKFVHVDMKSLAFGKREHHLGYYEKEAGTPSG